MVLFDVRRLAAIDMHGSIGSPVRRRVILTEFVLGVVGCVGLGVWLMADAAGAPARAIGGWLALIGVNYVPLALHAASLVRPDALKRELAGVDIAGELRRYTGRQLWLLVPLLPVVLAVRQARH
jgi:hypothetical protein